LRIALLSGEYPPLPGGVGDYTRRLGQALLARGHDVFVLTIADDRFQIIDVTGSGPELQSAITNLQSSWGWGAWRDVIAALARVRPEVLHIQYQTGAYGMRPAINLLPWRLRGLPARPAVAVTAHDLLLPYLFPKAGPLRRWVTRRLLADADALVVTNEDDFAQLARDWGLGTRDRASERNSQSPTLIPIGSNIAVAPPQGYDRTAWRQRLGIAPSTTLIAYFGLISRTKGLDALLGALARLPESAHLLLIGGAATAPEDRAFAAEVEHQIAAQSLADRVTFTGHCVAAEVSAHLLAADLAALPFTDGASFRRGSLLAALAHGLPTVTTSAPNDQRLTTNDQEPAFGPWSFVLGPLMDGENVLLVPPRDAGALARAIERLAADAALRARLAGGAKALAAQFSWDEIAARHEQLYRRLARP
jgi:glycosyltransferase involved in cell wall biosynthesis